jgi:hypothetical protein
MIETGKAIDNSLFIDNDGIPYLFFDHFNDGLNIWGAELKENLLEIKPGTMHKCIHVSQEWEEALQEVNAVYLAFFDHLVGPDTRLYFPDMCLLQEVHA